MKKVTIANINIELTMIDTDFLNKRMYEYENNTFAQGDMILKTIACDDISKPKGDLIKKSVQKILSISPTVNFADT